jgi:hypothetical protein
MIVFTWRMPERAETGSDVCEIEEIKTLLPLTAAIMKS